MGDVQSGTVEGLAQAFYAAARIPLRMDDALWTAVGAAMAFVAVAPAAATAARRRLLLRSALRSAKGHLRQGLAVALTAAIATATVAGALVVGDSMRALADETATEALPGIDALIRSTRPFDATLLQELASSAEWSSHVRHGAPVLTVPAAINCARTTLRDGQVTLYGIDATIYDLAAFVSDGRSSVADLGLGEVAINDHLSRETGAKQGDVLSLTVPNPGAWGDFLFLFGPDASLRRNLTVKAVYEDEGLGRLDLEAQRNPRSAVFMGLGEAQGLLGVEGQVNAVLLQWLDRGIVGTGAEERAISALTASLDGWVGATDIGVHVRNTPGSPNYTVVSDRVFMPGELEPRLTPSMGWSPTLTYFVDELQLNGLAYSTIAGIDFAKDRAFMGEWSWNASSPHVEPAPGSMGALVNNWTADALGLRPGDPLQVEYTVVDYHHRLDQRHATFEVVGVVDIAGKAADASLLPPIPGVEDVVSCLDWDPPFPMNLSTITPRDVAYWDQYRGTPKVWIDLGTARSLWTNPDGNWTGARWASARSFDTTGLDEAVLAADAGISIVPVRADALSTADALVIFEQMFLAFGAVLLLAGCLLESAAFGNLARARAREHATLRALGLDRAGLVRQLLLEGTMWGLVASVAGIALGAALGAGLVWGLNGAWGAAVQGAHVPFAMSVASLALALGAGLLVTVVTLFLAARRASRTDIAASLAGREQTVEVGEGPSWRWTVAVSVVFLAVPWALLASMDVAPDLTATGAFLALGIFATVGSTVLVVGIILWYCARGKGAARIATPSRLGLRSLGRRTGRTYDLVLTFAFVSFAVIGISWAGAMEVDRAGGTDDSRTGGFDVVAETWVPMPEGPGMRVWTADYWYYPVKVVGTQGGTCSNLNARYPPRIMGMPEGALQDITVEFRSSSIGSARETWMSLLEPTPEDRTPIVVDYNTLVWIYGGDLGDVYKVTGDDGRTFELEVVGVMEGSIFAGSFVMALPSIEQLYPDSAAYTYFLYETQSPKNDDFVAALERANAAYGLDARTTTQMVRDSLGYELSFLRLFQAYLALGLVVGALGLGALASREVRVRRHEIGTMRALGWSRAGVGLVFLAEQLWIAVAGLAAGIAGAAVAVVAATPGWLGSYEGLYFPVTDVGLVAVAVLVAAAVGAVGSARAASRMEVVDALRSVE